MSGFDLSNYKTVPERIAEAKEKYPDGRLQSRIIELPNAFAADFVAVEARFFRTADDPIPGVGLAWELVPGKTPYTKDSELQNAETSAWGRALIAAFAADASKGIATQEEVRNRQQVETATPPFDAAGYTKDAVQMFSKWSDKERADSFKKHSQEILGGKPVTEIEVRQVIDAMSADYYEANPDEAPF